MARYLQLERIKSVGRLTCRSDFRIVALCLPYLILASTFSCVFDEGHIVPKLTVEGFGEFEVPQGKRLVLALSEDAGVDQLHACGGNARCTTCRVEVLAGDPSEMTIAEKNLLIAKGISGVRLSCQMLCENDIAVRCISRVQGSGRPNPGSIPTPEISPPPEWTTKEA